MTISPPTKPSAPSDESAVPQSRDGSAPLPSNQPAGAKTTTMTTTALRAASKPNKANATSAATKNNKNRNNNTVKPTRSLSPYNVFFRHERARILALSQQTASADCGGCQSSVLDLGPPSNLSVDQVRSFLESNPYVTNARTAAGKPRRPHRKTHGVVSFTELNRIVSRNWRALDDESKRPFKAVAEEMKVRQKEEMREAAQAKRRDGNAATAAKELESKRRAAVAVAAAAAAATAVKKRGRKRANDAQSVKSHNAKVEALSQHRIKQAESFSSMAMAAAPTLRREAPAVRRVSFYANESYQSQFQPKSSVPHLPPLPQDPRALSRRQQQQHHHRQQQPQEVSPPLHKKRKIELFGKEFVGFPAVDDAVDVVAPAMEQIAMEFAPARPSDWPSYRPLHQPSPFSFDARRKMTNVSSQGQQHFLMQHLRQQQQQQPPHSFPIPSASPNLSPSISEAVNVSPIIEPLPIEAFESAFFFDEDEMSLIGGLDWHSWE